MIVSHKHKFIFIKPRKVAGTSVEINLAKHCGDDDIITPITQYSPGVDDAEYQQLSRNYKKENFFNHITPEEIKRKLGDDIWNNYFKFTIVRNPYDILVSKYFWSKYRIHKKIKGSKRTTLIKKVVKNVFNIRTYRTIFERVYPSKKSKYYSFEKFIDFLNKNPSDFKYYFDEKKEPLCDFYIKFENLEEDYKEVCSLIGIPYERLPKTKNKTRIEKKHYSEYYNDFTKKKVYEIYKKEIDFFDYKFEEI